MNFICPWIKFSNLHAFLSPRMTCPENFFVHAWINCPKYKLSKDKNLSNVMELFVHPWMNCPILVLKLSRFEFYLSMDKFSYFYAFLSPARMIWPGIKKFVHAWIKIVPNSQVSRDELSWDKNCCPMSPQIQSTEI